LTAYLSSERLNVQDNGSVHVQVQVNVNASVRFDSRLVIWLASGPRGWPDYNARVLVATVGTVVGDRFRIVRQLGEGGMGVVYEAEDLRRGGRVALKTLRTLSPDSLLRFKREFRSLQDLQHPGLVSLRELVEEGGSWLLTMEIVEGVGLLEHVRRPQALAADALADTLPPAPFDEVRLRDALSQLVAATAHLHAHGKVHRDIKPSNVRVTPQGRLVLLDFGLIAEWAPDRAASESHVVGTVAYMAPEQAASQAVGPPADWYAIGVVLFEAMTGRLPFEGKPLEVLLNKQRSEAPSPRALQPTLPEDLDALCRDLLQFDPSRRPTEPHILARLGLEPAGVPARASASSHSLAPLFVGRAHELGELHRAFEAARAGAASALLVRGESGVGKSALVRHFAETVGQVGGTFVLAGRCYERESVPFKAVDDVMDALSSELRRMPEAEAATVLPLHAAPLSQVFPVLRRVRAFAAAPRQAVELDPQEMRTRVFGAVRELLTRLVQRRPVILVIDDLQWADADSLSLLSAVLRQPDAPAILLLGTERRDSARDLATLPGARALDLGCLPPDEAWELAQRLLGPGDERSGAAAIAREAGGHPLFIDELVRHAQGSGATTQLHLDDALWQRVCTLEESARRLLEVLAVAGSPIVHDCVAAAARLPAAELARTAGHLRVANLVRGRSASSETLEVYHDRIREAVTARLTPDRVREHHHALALALETRGDSEALAFHWLGAGDPERALAHTLAAGDHAMSLCAFDRASRHYQAAVAIRPPGSQPLRARLARALGSAGRGKAAAAAYLEAVDGAQVAEALELRRRAAEELLRGGWIDEGLKTLEPVLRSIGMRLPASRVATIAAVVALRARIRLRGLGFVQRDESQVSGEELRRIDTCWSIASVIAYVDPFLGAYFNAHLLLRSLRAGEPYRVVRALTVEAGYASIPGTRSGLRPARIMGMARELATQVQNPHARGLIATVEATSAVMRGDFAYCREQGRLAEEILIEGGVGAPWEIDMARLMALFGCWSMGDLETLFHRVPALLSQADDRGNLFMSTALRASPLSILWIADDDLATAEQHIREAGELWSYGEITVQRWWIVVGGAWVEFAAGRAAAADRTLQSFFQRFRRSALWQMQNLRTETLYTVAQARIAAARHPGSSASGITEARELARRMAKTGSSWGRALAALVEAAAAWPDQARMIRGLGLARASCAEAGLVLFEAAAALREGQLRGDAGGQTLAREAEAAMTSRRVKRPELIARMLLPAIPVPVPGT